MKKLGVVSLLLAGLMLLAACQGAEETAPVPVPAPVTPAPAPAPVTPAPAPAPVTPAPVPAPVTPVAAGIQLYVDKGCAVCHGQNAEGTSIAPSLSGHNAEQVTRQVRNPLGTMPSSSPEQISDDELEKIIGYIESLSPVAEHVEPVAMEDALVMHHWMALSALEADNPDDAEHHVSHIIEFVTDAAHKAQMEAILEAIQAGDYHDASHDTEEMLVTKAEPELALKELHLQMALASIGSENSEDAKHHIEHYIDLVEGHDKEHALEVIDLLAQGNFHDAEHEVGEMLE